MALVEVCGLFGIGCFDYLCAYLVIYSELYMSKSLVYPVAQVDGHFIFLCGYCAPRTISREEAALVGGLILCAPWSSFTNQSTGFTITEAMSIM